MPTFTDVIARVPPGKVGIAELVHEEPDFLERVRSAMHGMALNRSKYARLLVNGSVMMTDAEFDRISNLEFIREAHGDVLIAGLGMGLVLDPLIKRCDSITVIEKHADVIELIAGHFPKVKVIHSDIWQWKPPEESSWDTIYFDIWANFNGDMAREGATLKRRFKKYLREDGWIGAWSQIANRLHGRR